MDRFPWRFVMDLTTARRVPWGILLLFGGGLSLAAALDATGVGAWLGSLVAGMERLPGPLLVVLVTTLVIFLTELTSNTATTASLVPILAGVAPGLGVPPLLLVVPAAIAASCAFMMPVATPPNAIVFGSGRLTIRQMARTGFSLNLLGIVLIPLLMYTVGAWILGIDLG
ncbi:MAG: SLC13 family permease [Pseudomonadota bacterium]